MGNNCPLDRYGMVEENLSKCLGCMSFVFIETYNWRPRFLFISSPNKEILFTVNGKWQPNFVCKMANSKAICGKIGMEFIYLSIKKQVVFLRIHV